MLWGDLEISPRYSESAAVTLFLGDRLDLLRQVPTERARLVVTSPPYNIGKKYEKRVRFDDYLKQQEETIAECVRVLARDGSLCWQVGNPCAPLDRAGRPAGSGMV